MIHDCFCFVVVRESLCLFCSVKLSTVLQKNPPFLQNLQFSSIFCIFEPFPAVTVWFWDPSFDTEDNWGTQTQLLTKGSNVHWCSLRKYDVLRARGLNIFEFEDQGKLYLICLVKTCKYLLLLPKASTKWGKHFYILMHHVSLYIFIWVCAVALKQKNIKIIRKVFVCTSKHISVSWLCMHIHGPKWEQVTEF